MKLIYSCNICLRRTPLNSIAETRNKLAQSLGIEFQQYCPHCGNLISLHVNQVIAETTTSKSYLAGGGLGTAVGIIGGPIGMFIGGIAGGAIGGLIGYNKEQEAVRRFNNSFV